MTSNPFGVNLTLLPALQPPDYPAYARVIIEEGIRIVETAGNNPAPVIKQLKAANPPCIILHKCTTVRHAISAVKLGVDFLSIDGFECAGHVGETDITNFILLSRARQELNVPFIASGGFADGQGLAAALNLGACGINMGTRFMCTVEAPIHQNIKEAIVKAQETDTELVLRRWKNTTRLFANKVVKDAVKIEKESPTGKFEEVAPYVSGKRGRQVFLNGEKEFGVSRFLIVSPAYFADHLCERGRKYLKRFIDGDEELKRDLKNKKIDDAHVQRLIQDAWKGAGGNSGVRDGANPWHVNLKNSMFWL